MPGYRYKLIDVNWGADELNEFLLRQYRFGLFSFAFSLATVFYKTPSWGSWDLWFLKKEGIPYYETCKQEIKKIREIRAEIVEKLDEHLDRLQFWDSLKGKQKLHFPKTFLSLNKAPEILDREKLTKKNYKLERTFKVIDDEIEYYEKLIPNYTRKRGRPVQARFIISSFWSLILRDSQITHWKNIEQLLEWFYRKLNGVHYSQKNEEHYSQEIYGMPKQDLVTRFRSENILKLENELQSFFKDFSKPQNQLNLQIRFEQNKMDFRGFDPEEFETLPKLIKFLDGSTFPE